MATENWCMKVGGKIYGPYPTAQMAGFVAEKRLAYHSMVAPAGSRDFRQALQFEELRPLFRKQGSAQAAAAGNLRTNLVILAGDQSAAGPASEVLGQQAEARPLSGSVYLIRGAATADELRDQLARVLPSTERAMVLALEGGTIATHGVALNEHETLAAILKSSVPQA